MSTQLRANRLCLKEGSRVKVKETEWTKGAINFSSATKKLRSRTNTRRQTSVVCATHNWYASHDHLINHHRNQEALCFMYTDCISHRLHLKSSAFRILRFFCIRQHLDSLVGNNNIFFNGLYDTDELKWKVYHFRTMYHHHLLFCGRRMRRRRRRRRSNNNYAFDSLYTITRHLISYPTYDRVDH